MILLVVFKRMIFDGFGSLFWILVGPGDLQNRPWPLKSERLACTRARFSKKHVFFIKNRGPKNIWFFINVGPRKSVKIAPKVTLTLVGNLVKNRGQFRGGSGGYYYVWHYTPWVKFARERRGFGRIPHGVVLSNTPQALKGRRILGTADYCYSNWKIDKSVQLYSKRR